MVAVKELSIRLCTSRKTHGPLNDFGQSSFQLYGAPYQMLNPKRPLPPMKVVLVTLYISSVDNLGTHTVKTQGECDLRIVPIDVVQPDPPIPVHSAGYQQLI